MILNCFIDYLLSNYFSDSVSSGCGDVINLEAATVTCTYSGLLTAAEVTWSGGSISGGGITASDGNFVVVQGSLVPGATAYIANTQVSTLTVNKDGMSSQASKTFTCSITLDNAVFTETPAIIVYKPGLLLFLILTFYILVVHGKRS